MYILPLKLSVHFRVFHKHKIESKYHFEGTKIFVEFIPPPGVFMEMKIPVHVYLALKMAKLGETFELDTISKEEAAIKMVSSGLFFKKDSSKKIVNTG